MRQARLPPAAPLAIALAAVATLAAGPAAAAAPEQQPLPCTGLGHLAGFLEETYGERQAAAGLQSDGKLLQIFSSPETGSWTAVATSPAGVACVVATGRHWEQQRGGGGGGPGDAYNPVAARP